jgi:cytochrome c-type biogenesis protein CcmH
MHAPLHRFGAILIMLALAGGLLSRSSEGQPAAASDKALEAVLLAPCCWNGTLSSHDSTLASELRGEIERRVAQGESTSRVEADLVDRYGSRIRAMPTPRAFSLSVALAAGLALFAALELLLALRRWRRSDGVGEAVPAVPAARDEYDARIDAELREHEESW